MASSDSSTDEELQLLPMLLLEYDALEDFAEPVRRGGSVLGRKANEDRDHLTIHARLWRDYFFENPRCDESTFRRRFRMSRGLFQRIHDSVVQHDGYFVQKRDATGRLGLSSYLKITAAIRILAYAMPADILGESLGMAESTVLDSLVRFCNAVVAVFGET